MTVCEIFPEIFLGKEEKEKRNNKKKTAKKSNQLSLTLLDVSSGIPNYTWTSPQRPVQRQAMLRSDGWIMATKTSWH